MLVNLYRSQSPLAVFSMPILVAVVCSSLFFRDYEPANYVFTWQSYLFQQVQQIPWINFLAATLLISFNAHQINRVFNRNAFYSKDTFLPGFLYIGGLVTFETLEFTPFLVGQVFLIGAFANALQIKRQEPAKNQVFLAGMLCGLTSIFSPALVLLSIFPWVVLILVKPFVWREWLLALIGYLLPIVYLVVIHFAATGLWMIKLEDLSLSTPENLWTILESATYILFALCVLLGLFRFFWVMQAQVVSFKKLGQVTLALLVLSFAGFLLGWYVFDKLSLGYMIPLGCLLSVQLLYQEKQPVMNLLFNAWFLLAAANAFIP